MGVIRSTVISSLIVMSSTAITLGALSLVGTGDTGESMVDIVAPTGINIAMIDGDIEVDNTDLKIINNSSSDIELSKISIVGENGWEIVDYNNDLTLEPENTKKLAMDFDGDSTNSTGKISLTDGKWDIRVGEEKALNLGVKIPIQTEPILDSKIAVVVYELQLLQHNVIFKSGIGGNLKGETEISVLDGKTVEFPIPTAYSGWEFKNWTDELGNEVTNEIEITTNKEITANFEIIENGEYSINFISGDGGSLLDSNGNISDYVLKTITPVPIEDITIGELPTPVPNEGYVFNRWVNSDGTEVNTDTKVTSSMIILAEFIEVEQAGYE